MHIVSGTPEERTNGTILCIDDDMFALQSRIRLLRTEGYRALAAASGQAAVKIFVAEEVDLIVTALVFPDISGAELSIFMRQVRPDVSVILVSRLSHVPAPLAKQVDGHITRHASARELLDCVERVMEGRRSQQLRA